MTTPTEIQLKADLNKRNKQLKELARMVIDEMSDPSPTLAKKLIKYEGGKF